MAEAAEQTGLGDFGGDTFREGLGAFCDAVDAEARLSDFGGVAVRANIVGSLANRLRIVDYIAADPTVVDEPVEAPLFVVGMFRAGTTLLSHLFDQDPANRALLSWEVA